MPIAHPVSFGGKTWAQIASDSSAYAILSDSFGTSVLLSAKPILMVPNSLDDSCLVNYLASLEHFLKLLSDQISIVMKKLNFFELMPQTNASYLSSPVTQTCLVSNLNSDMILDNTLTSFASFLLVIVDIVTNLSLSSSKILTTKMGELKSKIVALEVSVELVLERLVKASYLVSSGSFVALLDVWDGLNAAGALTPLEYIFNGAFSDVMCLIEFDEMSAVVLDLPNRKAAGLFGIPNEFCINKVITNFGLTGRYHVHDGLDQGEIGSTQAVTQHIFNVVSEFFQFNDIFINNDKTVAISINCQIKNFYLAISDLPIFVAKKGELHYYLGIFLSFKSLLKSSMAKAYLDFVYLVSAVLHLIISCRTQFSFIFIDVCNKWDALICRSLKSKSGFPLDFSNYVIHYSSLYSLKTFKQVQAKNKLAQLFPLQIWLFLACVSVNLLNNFLTDIVHIFSGYDLSLDNSLASAFCLQDEILMSFVLVYTNRSLCGLKTLGIKAGAAVFFKDVNLDLSVQVSGLLFSTMTELQAIVLAFECVPFFHSVDLFMDSQAALDAYVRWHKIRSYSGISGNKHANMLAKAAAVSN
ncbi:hypothetical protein G9A89_007428 [Geosiphon pyriformis]|nr:hypothetical protein G9A89_007428 [Geosiphon pyriformis]